MKWIFLIAFTAITGAYAQNDLNFNKRFVESEDKWIALKKDKDTSYVYGFIYIDAQAGLTLNYEGTFTINENGIFVPTKLEKGAYKIRLQANNVRGAWIPANRFAELKIDTIPSWLSIYKSDTTSVAHLYRWGYMYNGWNECQKALTYLERAQKIDPDFKGLSVELAFSYNCLEQYSKAISVLSGALSHDPEDAYVNKELVYAQCKSGQLDAATASYQKAVSVCKDKSYNCEMCYNILHFYYEKKDKDNFNLWLAEIKKWTAFTKETNILNSIKVMEENPVK